MACCLMAPSHYCLNHNHTPYQIYPGYLLIFHMQYHWTHTLGICIRYSIVCLILHNPIINPHLQEMQLLSHFFIVCTYIFFHFVECLLNMSIYFCDLSPEESLAEPLMIMSNLYHQSNALIHDCNLILNTLTDHHGWPTKHLSHMWKKHFEALISHAL